MMDRPAILLDGYKTDKYPRCEEGEYRKSGAESWAPYRKMGIIGETRRRNTRQDGEK